MKKIIPKLRFKGLTDNWQVIHYKDVYTFYGTNSFTRENLNYSEGKVMNIHYGDIHTKYSTLFDINKEVVPYINPDIDTSKIRTDTYCHEGDLVVADASEDYADIGKTIEIVNLGNRKLTAGLHTFLARPNKKTIAPRFGGYLVQSPSFRKRVKIIAQGTKVLSLSSERLGLLKLTIPTLPEQQKIASFLSAVDEKIQLLSRKKDLLEQYKKGVMQQLFSGKLRFRDERGEEYPKWERRKLGDILELQHGYQFRSSDFTKEGIAVIKIANVIGSSLDLNNLSFIDTNRYGEFARFEIKEGDVLMSLTGNIGRVVEVNMVPFTLIQNYRVGKFVPFDQMYLTKTFSKYLLMSDMVFGRFNQLSNQSAQANFGKQDMDKIQVLVPSVEEQKRIASLLSAIDARVEFVAKQIGHAKSFKKGLMQQMFV